MKTTSLLLAALCLFVPAALHAEEPVPVPTPLAPYAETAESKPHAESAEAAEPGSPAGGAAERSEAEGLPRSEPAENAGPAASRAVKPLRAEVSLTDGSLLKGSLRRRFLPAESATFGRFRLDLKAVKSIEFSHAESAAPKPHAEGAETAEPKPHAESAAPDLDLGFVDNDSGRARSPAPFGRISFRNGDTVTATLLPKRDHLVLDTLVGPLAIPLRAVASLAIASDATDALLYHCTFDSPSSITRPVVGPAGTFLGGDFVPGKVGNALRTPGDIPVAEIDLPRGFMQSRGTIEFWAKIEDPPAFYGDGGNPGFFGMWLFDNPSDPGPCSTYLCFNANNGMGMAGLCGMVYHRAMATDPHMRTNTYAPILSAPSDWHHYAIAWDAEGLSFATASDGTPAVATLVLDGRVLQTFGRNQLSRGKGLLDLPKKIGKLAFPVPAARWNASAKRVPFLIDEFKIWSEPRIAP